MAVAATRRARRCIRHGTLSRACVAQAHLQLLAEHALAPREHALHGGAELVPGKVQVHHGHARLVGHAERLGDAPRRHHHGPRTGQRACKHKHPSRGHRLNLMASVWPRTAGAARAATCPPCAGLAGVPDAGLLGGCCLAAASAPPCAPPPLPLVGAAGSSGWARARPAAAGAGRGLVRGGVPAAELGAEEEGSGWPVRMAAAVAGSMCLAPVDVVPCGHTTCLRRRGSLLRLCSAACEDVQSAAGRWFSLADLGGGRVLDEQQLDVRAQPLGLRRRLQHPPSRAHTRGAATSGHGNHGRSERNGWAALGKRRQLRR